LKIAHLADLHLGYRAYHRANERGINQREADVEEAFRASIERLLAIRPDLVLVAGDIFHSPRPPNAAIGAAFRGFARLADGLPGVPVVMIAGNHDSPRSNESTNIVTLLREIPGLHVVAEQAAWVRLPSIDVAVLCLPHNGLASGVAPEMAPDSSFRHNLLMLHGTVSGASAERKLRFVSEFGGETVPETEIGPERWTYVALGHYHLVTELAPNMWYAGSPERCSTNIWMEAASPKGFLVHDTETGRTCLEEVQTRAVVDLPRIYGAGLTASEIDERLRAAVEGVVGGIAGKLVRQVLLDVPRNLLREMDHAQLRAFRSEALHYQFDARAPSPQESAASGAVVVGGRRMSVEKQVEDFLRSRWALRSERIRRDDLVALANEYIREDT
jgi:DNA repair protein SbcD/Mre11